MQRVGAPALSSLNVGTPELFKELDAIWASVPLQDQKTYLRWQLLPSTAGYLPEAFGEESFNFYGKTLQGTPANLPRWRRVITTSTARPWAKDWAKSMWRNTSRPPRRRGCSRWSTICARPSRPTSRSSTGWARRPRSRPWRSSAPSAPRSRRLPRQVEGLFFPHHRQELPGQPFRRAHTYVII